MFIIKKFNLIVKSPTIGDIARQNVYNQWLDSSHHAI
jgi:hypothetical protein